MDEPGSKGRILVVDDTWATLDMVRIALENEGYEIMVANSGEEAIEKTELTPPDLVLLDVLMPAMDGFETCGRLKARDKTREIPIIFMTGLASLESMVAGFEAGGVDYVTKPIEIEVLLARVRTHLALRAARRELETRNERLREEIVERKKAEDEVRRLNAELEQRVEARTIELNRANEQLSNTHLRLERTLKFNEALLSAIPTPVFYKDAKGLYLGCNHAFTDIMGITSEEMMGKTVHELWPSEHAEVYHQKDLDLMRQPERQTYDFKTRDKNGVERDIIFAKDVFRDENDRVAGIVGAFMDITERKRAEEALKESEAHYRAVVEDQTELICRFQSSGTIGFVNEACCRYFGKRREDLIGESFMTFVAEEDRAAVEKHFATIDIEHPVATIEHRAIRPDGEIRRQQWTNRAIYDERGGLLCFQAVGRDVTKRKEMEEALRKSAEKIEFFAYSVAHDLKSPAVGIYGLARLLQKNYADLLDEKGKYCCSHIMKTAEQIAVLVENINLYIATKQAPLSIERVKTKEIVQMARDEFANRLGIRRIDLAESGSLPEILADRLGILRVMRNLVDNALKYGGDELNEIRIGFEEIAGFHVLSVSDNGVGIGKENSKRIFDPFQRECAGAGIQGTGLGLAIVKEIAEQHGGSVWVESEPGKGTTFFVSIAKDRRVS